MCIPAYAVVNICRAEGNTFVQVLLLITFPHIASNVHWNMSYIWELNFGLIVLCSEENKMLIIFQKLKHTTQPNIYECKICGEHHCEHDFPEDQSVQEMSPIMPIVPHNIVLQPPPPGNRGNPVNHVSSSNTRNRNETQEQ